MRVLLLASKEENIHEVLEINSASYDDNILGVSCDANSFDPEEYADDKQKIISGLSMCDADGDWLYIKGIPRQECNRICEILMQAGYADLSYYGEYEYV